MVTFRNNNNGRRNNFRRNDRNFKVNGDRNKFNNNFSNNESFFSQSCLASLRLSESGKAL